MPLEIATRWGDTLLEITHVDAGDFTLAGVELVRDGRLVAAPAGRVGHVDYTAVSIARPVRDLPYARPADRRWLPYAAAALLVHVGLWFVATTEHPARAHAPARGSSRPVAVTRIVAEPARTYVPPDDRARDRVADTKAQGQARAMQGPRGAAGARSPDPRGHVAVKNTGEEAQLAKAEAVARARRAGILGSTQVLHESYATLGGADRLTSAFDGVDVTAPLAGGEGTAGGTFGIGVTGEGAGGGGTTYGTIGAGQTGAFSQGTTHGHGWGGSRRPPPTAWRTWDQTSYTYAGFRPRPRTSRVTICPPRVTPCAIDGELDPAILRRHVKRETAKLSYCYEKKLLADRALARGGLVQITFAITPEGRARVARVSGFDPDVDACVRGVFEALQVPPAPALVAYVLGFDFPK